MTRDQELVASLRTLDGYPDKIVQAYAFAAAATITRLEADRDQWKESDLAFRRSSVAASARAVAAEAEAVRLREAITEAVDLLMERTRGSVARSPGHNARLRLQAALMQSAPKDTTL